MKPQNQDSAKTSSATSDQNSNSSRGIDTYLRDFQDAYRYVRVAYHNLWYDCYRLYNNRRTTIGYAGVNDAFVPETFTIIESLVANIAGGNPKFQFVPTYEEQNQDTEVLSNMIDYYWEMNRMGIKAQEWVRDSILYGTGVLHVSWDPKRRIPVVQNVPLRDFFVDPAATTVENARYIGFRYLVDKENLKKAQVLDPETGKMVPKYKNLADLEDMTKPVNGEPLDKQKKEMLLGSTLGSQNERQVEVVLMYYMDTKKVVEIANRNTVIRETDSPFQAPARVVTTQVEVNGAMRPVKKEIEPIECFAPFAVLRNYVDGSLFFGRGDVETIMARQETLNDVENMDLDNIAYYTNVMWQIDPQYADMVPEIESIPGAVYPIPKGALSVIERPVMNQDLDQKKAEIKAEMRAATAADEVIQGISQQSGRVTATEVSSTLSQAQQRFTTKITNLESEGYAQLAAIMFKMTQLFVDQPTAIRIAGPDAVTFKDFDPYDYYGWYEPHVKLKSTVEKLDLEQGQKLNQMYQMMLGNLWVNQAEALRFIFTKLGADQEEVNRLLHNPTPAPLRPKVDVSLRADLNPLQLQDLASQEGFGGEQTAQAMEELGLPIPQYDPTQWGSNGGQDMQTAAAMSEHDQQQQSPFPQLNPSSGPLIGDQPDLMAGLPPAGQPGPNKPTGA